MPSPKPVNLALQGGGAHGAFTWGVLDRILEDGQLEIVAVSGTSAGAMNAVVLAQGLHRGGPEGARVALERFWRRVAEAARTSPIQRSPFDVLTGNWSLDHNPAYIAADLLSRVVSPYEINPLGLNPLRDLLAESVDFAAVRACSRIAVHISATDVETGRVKVFDRPELTLDMVLASACLPTLYQAVEIDGRHYWDGGFMGNPVIHPFYDSSPSDDVIIVQINPVVRPGVPRTAREIANRINEISFNGALLRDLRAIDFVHRLLEDGRLPEGSYRHVRVHMIEDRKRLRRLGASSKLNAEWRFLRHLFAIGRAAADRWLEVHGADVGRCGTLDLRQMFEGTPSPRACPVRVSGAAPDAATGPLDVA